MSVVGEPGPRVAGADGNPDPGPAPDRVTVRTARPEEYPAVAELTVRAYVGGGFIAAGSEYVPLLADVKGRAETADVLVALHGGAVVGSVALATDGGPYAEHAGPDEAVFRMLAVAAEARGLGAGAALVQACLERAVAAGRERLVISTQPSMTTAHRLYARLGFVRNPERDWSPRPGVQLWSYARALDDLPASCPHCGRDARAGDHQRCRTALRWEPPRYCRACGRRMVVQVTPDGWLAACSRHGLRRADRSTATG